MVKSRKINNCLVKNSSNIAAVWRLCLVYIGLLGIGNMSCSVVAVWGPCFVQVLSAVHICYATIIAVKLIAKPGAHHPAPSCS